VKEQAAGESSPIVVRDELKANQHQLSGMVNVPTPCDELSVKTQSVSDTNFELVFTTWRQPSMNCPDDPTPRAFRTILFAPATGVYFVATLDGKAFPIAVIPVINGVAH
jgi:hypothetical protein